jgi:hypothetical protein
MDFSGFFRGSLEAAEDALKRFGELDMLKRVDEVNAMINRLNRQ